MPIMIGKIKRGRMSPPPDPTGPVSPLITDQRDVLVDHDGAALVWENG